jgi:hypothetical protein
MSSETPYELPNGEQIPVIDPETAAHNLRVMLERFRAERPEPLYFGDNGQPEGVVVPYAVWEQLVELADEAAHTDRAVALTRERLASAKPEDYVPIDDLAAEFGWDLDSNPPGEAAPDGRTGTAEQVDEADPAHRAAPADERRRTDESR